MQVVHDKLAGLRTRYAGEHIYEMDGCRWKRPRGTAMCARRTRKPLLRLNLEATTQALMESEEGRDSGVHPTLGFTGATRPASLLQ